MEAQDTQDIASRVSTVSTRVAGRARAAASLPLCESVPMGPQHARRASHWDPLIFGRHSMKDPLFALVFPFSEDGGFEEDQT